MTSDRHVEKDGGSLKRSRSLGKETELGQTRTQVVDGKNKERKRWSLIIKQDTRRGYPMIDGSNQQEKCSRDCQQKRENHIRISFLKSKWVRTDLIRVWRQNRIASRGA